MSNKDNLLKAGKQRALPPKNRKLPEPTETPLSDEITLVKEEPKEIAFQDKMPSIEKKSQNQEKNESTPIIKKGPGKPKKRKDGDKKISFWLDEDLVRGLFNNLKYGESAGALINDAVREYQKKHKTYQSN